MIEDRISTRPLVARAVRLLSQPRRSPADGSLVVGVGLRLAALDSSADVSERLIDASERVIAGVAGMVGEPQPPADWSDTAEALALMIAGRPVQRRHLTAARTTLGTADKVIDLPDRLRRTAEEPLASEDLAMALALAVSSPAQLVEALLAQEDEADETTPQTPGADTDLSVDTAGDDSGGVTLRAVDGGQSVGQAAD
ncbi:MAG TPA: hypothetical protein VK053_18955 [Jiangellaceae bacterium]|nr:hypothetical protein [Jiangellaceae bacterium]